MEVLSPRLIPLIPGVSDGKLETVDGLQLELYHCKEFMRTVGFPAK